MLTATHLRTAAVGLARRWAANHVRRLADLVEGPPDPDGPDTTTWRFDSRGLHSLLMSLGVDRDTADHALVWLTCREVAADADLTLTGMGDQR